MVSFLWSAKAQKTLALKISVMQKRKKMGVCTVCCGCVD